MSVQLGKTHESRRVIQRAAPSGSCGIATQHVAMTTVETAEFVEGMLRDFSPFSSTLGGLEFYGYSTELRDVLQLCHNVASPRTGTIENPQKTYLFIEPHHGKTTIAKATDNQAKSNGLTSFYLDGTAGATQKP